MRTRGKLCARQIQSLRRNIIIFREQMFCDVRQLSRSRVLQCNRAYHGICGMQCKKIRFHKGNIYICNIRFYIINAFDLKVIAV